MSTSTNLFQSAIRHQWQVIRTEYYTLLGTSGSWFILDVVFYANGLFSGQITSSMGFGSDIKEESLAQLMLQVTVSF